MVTLRKRNLVATLRQRLLRALQTGAIAPGDRLPGTRELAAEYDADPRVVAGAFRELAAEGLVELRPRSGVFVSATLDSRRAAPQPSAAWLARLFAEGLAHGIAVPDLPAIMRSAIDRTRGPVAVIASSADQTLGICRELQECLGLPATGVLIDALPDHPMPTAAAEAHIGLPRAVVRAPLLVTTEVHAERIGNLAKRLRKPSIGVSVRLELYETEWSLLHGVEAYVLVADPRFGLLVADYLHAKRSRTPVHVRVVGRDDISDIPHDAPVYATQAARNRLGPMGLPHGLLPPARVLSDDCLEAILRASIELARDERRAAG